MGPLQSKVRAVIFIFYFSDRRSLKTENENNSMETKMQKFNRNFSLMGSMGPKNEFWSGRVDES